MQTRKHDFRYTVSYLFIQLLIKKILDGIFAQFQYYFINYLECCIIKMFSLFWLTLCKHIFNSQIIFHHTNVKHSSSVSLLLGTNFGHFKGLTVFDFISLVLNFHGSGVSLRILWSSCLGSSDGWSILPIHEGCGFNPQSVHIWESTSEGMNR